MQMSQTGQQRLIAEISQQYASRPLEGLREYLTNAIDAIDAAVKQGNIKRCDGLVSLVAANQTHQIRIQDNANGMSHDKLIQLPKNIGESAKYEHFDQRGEKAVGLLSFASLGYRMHIITRLGLSSPYNALRYEFDKEKGLSWEEVEIKNDQEMNLFGGRFTKGTRIILDVDKDLFRNYLTVERIRDEVRGLYWPLLDKHWVTFHVGTDFGHGGAPKMNSLSAFQIRGESILEENIPFTAKRQGKEVNCLIYAHLWLDTEGAGTGRIAVHSKGVRVYKSIIDLEDEAILASPLWTCKQLRGYIEEPHLALTLGRDRINTQRESNVYRGFIETLSELGKRLWPVVEGKMNQEKERKDNKRANEIFSLASEAYKLLPPYWRNRRTRGPVIFKGNTDGTPSTPEKEGEVITPPDKNQPKFPCQQFDIRSFGMEENHLRSKLEVGLGGINVAAVNASHPNYVQIVRGHPDSPEATEYLLRAFASAAARADIQAAIKAGARIESLEEAVQLRIDDIVYSGINTRLLKK